MRSLTDVLISVNQVTADGALAAGIGRPEQYVTILSGFELAPFLETRERLLGRGREANPRPAA